MYVYIYIYISIYIYTYNGERERGRERERVHACHNSANVLTRPGAACSPMWLDASVVLGLCMGVPIGP